MNSSRIFSTSPNNNNKYYNSIPLSTNPKMNQRLKRKQFKNKSPFISNYFQRYNKIHFSKLGNSYRQNISQRDFHKNVQLRDYIHRPYYNDLKYDFTKQKKSFNNCNSSTILEKDMDMMKIQMSCDLITHKINQIKNRVQDLHESSMQDDKYILNKNRKDTYKFNIFGRTNNNRQLCEFNRYNNSLMDDYNEYNYNPQSFYKIDDYSKRKNSKLIIIQIRNKIILIILEK